MTSVSLNSQLGANDVGEIVTLLSHCHLQRLRLVVNAFGHYMQGFSPRMIGWVVGRLMYLEELILDQFNMQTYNPLPGSWVSPSPFSLLTRIQTHHSLRDIG